MAERIQVELVDDIDGSPAQHTITFALDGVTYEVDLSDRHAKQLRSVLARYIDHARPASERTVKQEREEQRSRQENRNLTEQIRGAAKRTREHLNKQAQDVEQPDEDARTESEDQNDAVTRSETALAPQGQYEDKTDRVAAVSMPHFSSAVD